MSAQGQMVGYAPLQASSAQGQGNNQKLSEMDQLKLHLTDALGFLHAQATALEEIYGKLSGEYSQIKDASQPQHAPQPAGHVSAFNQISQAIHKRISETDAVIAKLDALI